MQHAEQRRPLLHIVVAHHSHRAFEPLVEALIQAVAPESARVHVYDKSPAGYDKSLGAAGVCGANVGRESESYLRHIIDAYEMLPEYVLFIQDDTHVHVPPHHAAACTLPSPIARHVHRVQRVMARDQRGVGSFLRSR